jgi:23S rRNA (adenine2030-N6)-methyltransferase
MEPRAISDFLGTVQRSGIRKVLRLELVVRDRDDREFIPGCGMLVVNPPWHFDSEARAILKWLQSKLVMSGRGEALVEWLVPE